MRSMFYITGLYWWNYYFTDSKEEFKQFLNEVDETMKERGLTENILQEILKEG